MIFCSQKRFEREVRRQARKMYRDTCTDTTLELISNEIAKLRREVATLKKQVQKQKGVITGFYEKNGEVTICGQEKHDA